MKREAHLHLMSSAQRACDPHWGGDHCTVTLKVGMIWWRIYEVSSKGSKCTHAESYITTVFFPHVSRDGHVYFWQCTLQTSHFVSLQFCLGLQYHFTLIRKNLSFLDMLKKWFISNSTWIWWISCRKRTLHPFWSTISKITPWIFWCINTTYPKEQQE